MKTINMKLASIFDLVLYAGGYTLRITPAEYLATARGFAVMQRHNIQRPMTHNATSRRRADDWLALCNVAVDLHWKRMPPWIVP